MSHLSGNELSIRAMVYVAAAQVPFFWPMRAFIHHNPLHGLEHLPFAQAVDRGEQLFHAQGYLARAEYQAYLQQGRFQATHLQQAIDSFVNQHLQDQHIDYRSWLMQQMTQQSADHSAGIGKVAATDVYRVLKGESLSAETLSGNDMSQQLQQQLLNKRLFFEVIDNLYATQIGIEHDQAVIKACLDFFDEGQSVWPMPNREKGFFHAWLDVAGSHIEKKLQQLIAPTDSRNGNLHQLNAEQVVIAVLTSLKIDQQHWVETMTNEFTRLHGWTGFIRWRASNAGYYWQQRYPADLVDYLAIRLLLHAVLLDQYRQKHIPQDCEQLQALIDQHPHQVYLRLQLHSSELLISHAQDIEQALAANNRKKIEQVYQHYQLAKRWQLASQQASRLRELAGQQAQSDILSALSEEDFQTVYQQLQLFADNEGMIWLQAMEAAAIGQLTAQIDLQADQKRDKRPFAKALFCIDTRSERFRRHLETVGDYQTYGIAGFFGVPVSFMELGKGSENHLCPVLLKPKNLVMEMTPEQQQEIAAFSSLQHALHELKESVITPFVTVEAIGLLFGFDMIGKTLMPSAYNAWRQKLKDNKPATHLMLDKLDRDQADSIVRAVQRAVIVKAIALELKIETERVSDDVVREIRELALLNSTDCRLCEKELKLDKAQISHLLERLRSEYRINRKFARLQLERLGRIGFSLEEQVRFVSVALQSIGLNNDFSRFILMVGHGSSSENNPYESALDCGACGGSHGLVSARVITQMANKTEVRASLRLKGIDIPDDCWFVPALHNTTTDEITLHDLALLPPSHLIYLDRLREGLNAASLLCAQERLPTLQDDFKGDDAALALQLARRNSLDWSQVRPEWGLSGNAFFIIGRRCLTQQHSLAGRAFLHSYDYRNDPKRRLLENILTGPLVVGQWINMEHYFSTVDNQRFGSGSKVYHNVAGRFGVMTGNYSDLRTGLPAQTVLKDGKPYHQPMRLITLIEAPFEMALAAIDNVSSVKRLVRNEWIRMLILDPVSRSLYRYENGQWLSADFDSLSRYVAAESSCL